MASPQNSEKFASICLYRLLGMITFGSSLALTGSITLPATSLKKSLDKKLPVTGVVLSRVTSAPDCQYSGLNAFWMSCAYVLFKPFAPGVLILLASAPPGVP